MNNYKFDMDRLLKEFENDPEKLAKAFTLQLNDSIAKLNAQKEIDDAAKKTAENWNNFVIKYFKVKGVKLDPQAFFFTPEDMHTIMNAFVEAYPYIEKYEQFLNTVEDVKETIQTKKKEKDDNFEKIINDWFKKNNI